MAEDKQGKQIKKPISPSVLSGLNISRQRSSDIIAPAPKKTEPPKKPQAKTQPEDQETSKAIDDIVMTESNEVLAFEDTKDEQTPAVKRKLKKGFSFKKLLRSKWLYISLPIIVLIIIFSIPYTRYKLLGLVLKNDYQFSLIDSTTNSPIGGAVIQINGQSLTTGASGNATIDLKLGKYKYSISKALYKTATGVVLVGLRKTSHPPIKLVATGRQISIELTNKLTGLPVAGADISILSTSSVTNSKGVTSLVLPTKSEAYLANISANGYDTQTTSVILTKKVSSFYMIPSGNLFFLVNDGGTINVEKTNLDGSDPQDLLPGTGNESAATTSLLPSPDWKYLLLEANRGGSQPELYIINTSTGDITEFDSSPDQFNLIGWSNDDFIYDEIDSGQPTSTVGREQLKSYNALSSKLNILDQNQVDSAAGGYAYQSFSNFNLIAGEIVYITNWATSGTYDTSTLTTTIRGVQADGSNKNDFQTFSTPNTGAISVVKNSPTSIYFSVVNTQSSQTQYYQYSGSNVNQDTGLSPANFSQPYPTYLLSPSGSESLWTQNGTFEGDQNGLNQKQITTANGFSAYSWFDNVYILIAKSSQLYIAPVSGSYQPTLVSSFVPSAS